ncbi:Histone-lysine N-methyltransferase, H3 lysine-76 specific [Trypanosoma equiperdum]|uniref:Histone-lysine N-methyltransferase, H3 lysine-79 specific n=1 Tax=Trypanosoma equiperdum TaxID=5694 RepID=A0A1G4I2K6_TRYEQ|nr:Histone-lysine N-methyltransferase, H3 lysine-76 specific [Trypanosoma equiperdum]
MDARVHRSKRGCGRVLKRSRASSPEVVAEVGTGRPGDPFVLPLRSSPNGSGCHHCPEHSCDCLYVSKELERCYLSLQVSRQVTCKGRRELCAKSVLPPFVARLLRVANVTADDTFYDLGCGNGSVLFHVALATGASCVGVEINEHNAKVAKEAWTHLRPVFEKRRGRKLDVSIVCGDFCKVLKQDNYFSSSCVVWIANLLMPRFVNHYLSERLRSLPIGSRVLCMEDLYPHSRSVAAARDPDAFEKFEMFDYRWQEDSVEWSPASGPFYLYIKRS